MYTNKPKTFLPLTAFIPFLFTLFTPNFDQITEEKKENDRETETMKSVIRAPRALAMQSSGH